MIVRSLNMLLLKVVCSIASVSTSTAAVASSSTAENVSGRNIIKLTRLPRMFVGVSSALAKETSCRCPADKFEPAPTR